MGFEPLKYIYSQSFYDKFLSKLISIVPALDTKEFKDKIFAEEWENKELKERMRHTTLVLHHYLDKNFQKAVNQITTFIEKENIEDFKYGSLAFLFLADYIEIFGIEYYDISMKSFEKITPFTSCEFAVRPFIIQNPKASYKILEEWSNHPNFHVRRLASEGCRPRLPWGTALINLKKDPSPILPILENLQDDKEDYVYRSVANNLNDISKDHPKLVLEIANKWHGKSKTKDWLVKHSLRTLLKKGDQKAMDFFGYNDAKDVIIDSLILSSDVVKIGEYLSFSFKLINLLKGINRLEYAIYFLRKNQSHSKKVFKISEKEYQVNSTSQILKKHSFKIISTRKYYPGKHKISIIINGKEKVFQNFSLGE